MNDSWGLQVMPKTYSNEQQRFATFRGMYWNQKQQRVMWQFINNPQKKPVVLFSIPKATGTSYHRVEQPIRLLMNRYPNDYVFVYAEPATIADAMKCDILQMHRARPQHDTIFNFFNRLPNSVKKPVIVNNIDDLEYQIPKTHYLYNDWIKIGKDKMSIRMFKESDYNLITSWNYQKTIQRDIGFNYIKGKTYKFPNYIDYELPQWCHTKRKKQKGSPIKIGWIGLVSHNIDLVYIHNIWKPLSQKYGNRIEFYVSSPNSADVEFRDQAHGLMFTRKKGRQQKLYGFSEFVNGLFADITKSKVTLLQALPLSEYGRLYRDLDISFIVVQPNKFNKAKSEIKITQSVMNRCIPVYNNFGPYSEWDQKCRNYLKQKYGNNPQGIQMRKFLNLCSHNIHNSNIVSSWMSGLSQMFDNWHTDEQTRLRQKFINFIYEFNIKEYGMCENIHKRKQFYDKICAEHKIS